MVENINKIKRSLGIIVDDMLRCSKEKNEIGTLLLIDLVINFINSHFEKNIEIEFPPVFMFYSKLNIEYIFLFKYIFNSLNLIKSNFSNLPIYLDYENKNKINTTWSMCGSHLELHKLGDGKIRLEINIKNLADDTKTVSEMFYKYAEENMDSIIIRDKYIEKNYSEIE